MLPALPGLVKFKAGIADVTFSDDKKYLAVLQAICSFGYGHRIPDYVLIIHY